MKLLLVFAVSVLSFSTLGCTKKVSPEFEAEVRAWQAESCSCYRTKQACSPASSPETELSSIEHLLVNAGALTDARRDVVRAAQDAVRRCAREAATADVRRQRLDALDTSLKNLNFNVTPPNTRGVTAKTR
jgi:hypothetical protein